MSGLSYLGDRACLILFCRITAFGSSGWIVGCVLPLDSGHLPTVGKGHCRHPSVKYGYHSGTCHIGLHYRLLQQATLHGCRLPKSTLEQKKVPWSLFKTGGFNS